MTADPHGARRRDAFLGGKLVLHQLASGHRAGTDAALLAAAASLSGGRLIDAGAGVGAAGLAVALREPQVDVTLVEIDSVLADLAQENIQANGLTARARVVVCDILSPVDRRRVALEAPIDHSRTDGLGASGLGADMVICNPPWLDRRSVRASPDARRARAHVAGDGGDIGTWLRAACALLRGGGRIVLIHRADAVKDILLACEGRFGDIRLLPVHPSADASAIRVLVSARKGARGPIGVRPGLILHKDDGAFTSHADAIHRGEAMIDFG